MTTAGPSNAEVSNGRVQNQDTRLPKIVKALGKIADQARHAELAFYVGELEVFVESLQSGQIYDRIIDVVDRVKLDDRNLDTNEYADGIVTAVLGKKPKLRTA